MASVCEMCGKKPSFGMNVSHSHRRTKRRWNPNIQRVRAIVNGTPKRVNVCTVVHQGRQDHQDLPGQGQQGRSDHLIPGSEEPSCRASSRPTTPSPRDGVVDRDTDLARVRPRARRARRLGVPHAAPGPARGVRPRRAPAGHRTAPRFRGRHGHPRPPVGAPRQPPSTPRAELPAASARRPADAAVGSTAPVRDRSPDHDRGASDGPHLQHVATVDLGLAPGSSVPWRIRARVISRVRVSVSANATTTTASEVSWAQRPNNQKLNDWVERVGAGSSSPTPSSGATGPTRSTSGYCQLLVDAGTFTPARTTSCARTASSPCPIPATSPGSRTAPSSAPSARSTPARPTTGGPRPR